jgi:hypothetical protein
VRVGSRLHVLRVRTHFRLYRRCRLPFSCFSLPDTFSAMWRASSPGFMFCAFGLVFSGYVRVFSRFHVLHAPNSFSAVSTASGPVFMFCVPEYIFGDTDGFGSRFHVLSSRTHFRRYCGRPLRFSCFALPDMFLAVKRASDPVFIFCAPELIFGGPKGVGSRTHFCAIGIIASIAISPV